LTRMTTRLVIIRLTTKQLFQIMAHLVALCVPLVVKQHLYHVFKRFIIAVAMVL